MSRKFKVQSSEFGVRSKKSEARSKREFCILPLAFCLLPLASFLLFTVVYADDLNTIVSKIQKTYDGIYDIQANFVQLTTSASIKQTQKAEGVVYFKKPGMMKWEYRSPNTDIIVSDGKTLWAYQQDIGQVMTGNASTNETSISNNFLSGMGNLKKDFDIELAEQDNISYVLKLKPKAPQPNVQKLYIAVDKKTFFVVKTIVYDLIGNETRVIFENIKINQSISTSIFKFKIPEGVKVVK
ncbi:MAG: outer membrane lipoprotein chaperone LolA [Deltaproteobacteria bacterium]|nr:outer membrane lipoprotein chaperone LolA [Deltaproteobacteria bacterium]